jgi:Small-conductance mechanosensitive channel
MKSKSGKNRAADKKYGSLIRAVILAAIAALVFLIGRNAGIIKELPKFEWNGKAVLRGVLILLIMFAAEGLVLFLLNLPKPKNNRARTLISLAKNMLRYAVILAAICVALTIFNVDIVTILAGLGILALIIGFGAESLIADIVTGMFILIDNQYNIGDIIEVDGFRGTVTEINVRSTVLTDVGGNVKIINNSDVKTVVNMTNQLSLAICDIGIEYGESLERVESILKDNLPAIKEAIPDIKEGPYYRGVAELGDSAVVLRFVANCEEDDRYQVERDLNRQFKLLFDKYNINIPFTQVVVNQPVEFENATGHQKRAADQFVVEQKELSKGIADSDVNAI